MVSAAHCNFVCKVNLLLTKFFNHTIYLGQGISYHQQESKTVIDDRSIEANYRFDPMNSAIIYRYRQIYTLVEKEILYGPFY